MKNAFDSLESIRIVILSLILFTADESDNGVGLCGWLLTTISWGLVMVTLPFSLCVCFKVGISNYNVILQSSIVSSISNKVVLDVFKIFQHRLYKSMKERLYLDLVDS